MNDRVERLSPTPLRGPRPDLTPTRGTQVPCRFMARYAQSTGRPESCDSTSPFKVPNLAVPALLSQNINFITKVLPLSRDISLLWGLLSIGYEDHDILCLPHKEGIIPRQVYTRLWSQDLMESCQLSVIHDGEGWVIRISLVT